MVCPLIIIKSGNPVFSYSATIDFGDGYIQNMTLSNLNASSINMSHPYLTSGTFSVKFSVPALNISKTLRSNTIIYG